MKRNGLIPVVMCLMISMGCVSEDGTSVDVQIEHRQRPLIFGQDDRILVHTTEEHEDARIQVGGQYALATGQTSAHSGAMISRRVFLTSRYSHGNRALDNTIYIKFYSRSHNTAFARQRLIELGGDPNIINALDDRVYVSFTCDLFRDFSTLLRGYRDMLAYVCRPNTVPGLGDVYPGEIWGWMIPEQNQPLDTPPVYSLGHGRNINLEGARQFLLAPAGRVTNPNVPNCGQAGIWGVDGRNCFTSNLDTDILLGDAGGPVLNLNTHRLFGIHKYSLFDLNTNYHTHIPNPQQLTPVTNPPQLRQLSAGITRISTPLKFQGNTTFVGDTLRCPAGHLVAGITAPQTPIITNGWGILEGLGLICVPVVLNGQPTLEDRHIERWRVIATNANETESQWGIYDFNAYIHEHIQWDRPFEQKQQQMRMCAPGQYLSGLTMSMFGEKAVGVRGITCRSIDGFMTNQTLPDGFGLNTLLFPQERINCRAGQFITGLTSGLAAGYYTEHNILCRGR